MQQNMLTLTNLAVLLITFAFVQGTSFLSNEYCSARPTLVALGEPEYDFFPYFVKLNRCGGSCGSTKPTVQECVATEYTEVEISQISPVNGKHNLIKVKNHTKCGCSCVAKPDQCHPTYEMWNQNHCGCQCLYRNSDPPTPCKAGFKWNRASCKCMCARVPTTCGPQQMWSQEACDCVTKGGRIAKDTKGQTGASSSNTKLFIALLVGESFVLIILCAVLLHTRCKTHRANKAGSTDYAKSPIITSSENFNLPENTRGKENSFVATEVSMVSETGYITRKK